MSTSDHHREALVTILRESAKTLAEAERRGTADATGARLLQGNVQSLWKADASKELHFVAFVLDLVIQDVSENVFGDLLFTEGSEAARETMCAELRRFFDALAEALESEDTSAMIDCFQGFVSLYLHTIRTLNAEWASKAASR